MFLKIELDVTINTSKPEIYFKNTLIKLSDKKRQCIKLQDKVEIGSIFNFSVKKIENKSSSIAIKKLTINDVEANTYQNTFIMRGNRWVQEKKLVCVYRIDFNGKFELPITTQFIDPIRAQYWYVSDRLNDYVFNYNFTHDAFDLKYKPRNHDEIIDHAICVLGDSFTFGVKLENEETWPALLENKLKQQVNNLAVPGSGIDIIYNNFKKLSEEYSFNKFIIVLPNLERRVIKCFLDNDKIYRVPNVFSPDEDKNPWRYANHESVKKRRKHVEKQIAKDVDCVYSKKLIKKLIDIAEKKKINLFISARSRETYYFLKLFDLTHCKLLPFYDLRWFNDRASDDSHPAFIHNSHFVDLIIDEVEYD